VQKRLETLERSLLPKGEIIERIPAFLAFSSDNGAENCVTIPGFKSLID
jgi:hypothetical protein